LAVDIHGPQNPELPKNDEAFTCIAFRGDMDALPMTEENPQLPYRSQVPKCAHMCGHDGHMATLMGFAKLLGDVRHNLPPNSCVRLLFQPAEEGGFGAVEMIKDGCLEGVDEVYGYHNGQFPFGNIHVKSGAMLSHACRFFIDIQGDGGHGSSPHITQDPVLVAGHIIVAMQSIVSRNISPHESAVLSITQVHSGEADNVIPTSASLSGTMRDFNPDVALILRERMEKIVKSVSDAFNVRGSIKFQDGYPVVVNAKIQTEIVKTVASKFLHVSESGLPQSPSEDFSYYLKEKRGCFFIIGTQTNSPSEGALPDTKTVEGPKRNNHRADFDFNDAILPISVRMYLEIVQHRLKCELYLPDEMEAISSSIAAASA